MRSFASHDRSRAGGRLLQIVPLLGLTGGLLLPLLSGCPGVLPEPASRYDGGGTGTGGMTGGGTGGSTVGACDAPTMYFQNTSATAGCGNASCHSGIFSPNLVMPDPWSRLVGVNATLGTTCVGMPLVNPAKPADGVLIKRVGGSACGSVMPFGATTFDQATLDCIKSWVNSKLP